MREGKRNPFSPAGSRTDSLRVAVGAGHGRGISLTPLGQLQTGFSIGVVRHSVIQHSNTLDLPVRKLLHSIRNRPGWGDPAL